MDMSKQGSVKARPMWLQALRKRWAVIALAAVLILAGIVGALAAQEAFQKMMGVSGTSKTQFDAIPVGGQVEAMLEIKAMPSDKLLNATLLEPVSDGTYQRTSTTLNINLAADTKVVMGQASDVKAGAVIQIQGRRDDEHTVSAHNVVILTGYVAVQ